jgi:hypothetical protein
MLGRASPEVMRRKIPAEVMPGGSSGEVRLLRRKFSQVHRPHRESRFLVPTLRVQVVRSRNRSRIKSGMTAYGYSENAQFCHSDKAPGRNLDAIASQLSPANKEPSNGEPVCFDLPRPETRFAGLFYLQLTTHNLHLGTDPLVLTNPLPPTTFLTRKRS